MRRPSTPTARAGVAVTASALTGALALAGSQVATAHDSRPSASPAAAATSGQPAPAPAPALDRTPTRAAQIPNLGLVKQQIRSYYGDTGDGRPSADSAYAAEVRRVETRVRTYLADARQHPGQQHGKRTPALVLDVDDTSLLTYNYEAAYDFGYLPAANAAYILGQRFPAVYGMPRLATWATRHGFTLFFVTGRPDSQQKATEGNLAKVGYPTPKAVFTKDKTAPYPAYLPCSPDCTTVQYKSGTRRHIEALGYRIVANVGDQRSDLAGGHARRGFKMPNPMYFIP